MTANEWTFLLKCWKHEISWLKNDDFDIVCLRLQTNHQTIITVETCNVDINAETFSVQLCGGNNWKTPRMLNNSITIRYYLNDTLHCSSECHSKHSASQRVTIMLEAACNSILSTSCTFLSSLCAQYFHHSTFSNENGCKIAVIRKYVLMKRVITLDCIA